jgi:hypothetical protein
MQKTININNKKTTVKQIIAKTVGMTKGDDYISEINGARVVWNYRHDEHNGIFNYVCEKELANNISVMFTGGDKHYPCDIYYLEYKS